MAKMTRKTEESAAKPKRLAMRRKTGADNVADSAAPAKPVTSKAVKSASTRRAVDGTSAQGAGAGCRVLVVHPDSQPTLDRRVSLVDWAYKGKVRRLNDKEHLLIYQRIGGGV